MQESQHVFVLLVDYSGLDGGMCGERVFFLFAGQSK